MIDSDTFFVIWLTFTILTIFAIIPFVIWAVRSGQFSRFDYAGRLALKSRIVEDQPKKENKNVSA
jgi:nitrogen fixation-related uncharacterized protein